MRIGLKQIFLICLVAILSFSIQVHYVQAATEDSNLTGINAIYSMEIKKQEQGENNTEKSLVINKVTEDYGDKVLIETTYIPEVGLSREIKFIVPKESL